MPSLIAANLTAPSEGPYRRHVSNYDEEPDWCPSGRYAKALARLCAVGNDTRVIREELRFLANRAGRVSFEAVDEIVRLACRDGFDPDPWIENPEARRSGLFRCHRLWVRRGSDAPDGPSREISFEPVSLVGYYESESMFVELAHAYFFSCLADAADDRFPAEVAGLEAGASEVSSFLYVLRDLAAEAAGCKRTGRAVGAAWLLARLARAHPPNAKLNDLKNRFVRPEPVARIVVAVAQDLEELQHAATGEASLTEVVIAEAIDGAWTWARIWVEDRVERRLTLVESAARLLIDRERTRLRSSRDHLHARAEEYASLAQFCQLHRAPAEEARSLARLSARNLLGHGFHKDTILFDVLEAIRAVSGKSKARALTRLKAISPVVQVVGEITDGDETRHLERELAEVVAEVAPEALPPYMRALQRDYHHWQVETCFTDLAMSAPLRTVYEKALARTLVHEEALAALRDRANRGDPDAEVALADTLTHCGRQLPPQEEPRTDSGATVEENGVPPVEDYPPDRLDEFVRAVRDARVYGDEHLAVWTTHWRWEDPEGLLAVLTTYRAAHGHLHERETGRVVVELALEWSGLSAAWEWLVAYHEALYGWHRFYRLADVKWIWEFVNARFKDRWLDFIGETSRPRWSASGGAPSWSTHRMVAFLETVGQADRVDEVLDAAVRWGAGLAADMRLPDPALTSDAPDLPPALRLLADRLDSPSRMAQERAAWSLAELLVDSETRDVTETALLDWHASEPLEMRSCVLLVLLHLARAAHGFPANDCVVFARRAGVVPSVGADLLLREFGDEGVALAASLDHRAHHSRRPGVGFTGIEDFGATVGAHLAPLFRRWAGVLDGSGVPFSRQWEWEAAQLARRQGLSLEPNAHFDSHYRGGVDGPSLPINDRLSMVLRSAYLRALQWSIDEASLDVDRAEIHARWVAALADPALWAVRPSGRPGWWPVDPEHSGLDTLGEDVGRSIRDRLEQRGSNEGEEVLLYAAGPVGNRPHLRAELSIRAFLQSLTDR